MMYTGSPLLNSGLPMGTNHHTVGHLTVDGCGFACIYDFYTGSLSALYDFDAILIEHTSHKSSRQLILRIQSCADNNLFLAPIIIRSDYPLKDEILESICDGRVGSVTRLSDFMPTIKAIHHKIREIKISRQSSFEHSTLFDFLAYCFTRGLDTVDPLLDGNSSLAYFYPYISGAMENTHGSHSIFPILEWAVQDGYLHAQVINATYVCSQCHGGFLSYREVCPSCHSAHLRTEDIVHHFRCAHVAPLSDFKTMQDGEVYLECPKCHHELKHIGVDYDKPSSMHYCQSCNSDFQNYLMKAQCTSCHHDQEVEYLIKKEIRSFSLTDKAAASLRSGYLLGDENQLAPEVEGALPWDLFMQSLQFEQSNRNTRDGYVITLAFEDIKSLVRQIGVHNKVKLYTEVIQIVQASQHSTDIRTLHNHKIIFSLFKTSKEEAESISQRTVFLINHLLKDNLKVSRNMILTEILPFKEFTLDPHMIHQSD